MPKKDNVTLALKDGFKTDDLEGALWQIFACRLEDDEDQGSCCRVERIGTGSSSTNKQVYSLFDKERERGLYHPMIEGCDWRAKFISNIYVGRVVVADSAIEIKLEKGLDFCPQLEELLGMKGVLKEVPYEDGKRLKERFYPEGFLRQIWKSSGKLAYLGESLKRLGPNGNSPYTGRTVVSVPVKIGVSEIGRYRIEAEHDAKHNARDLIYVMYVGRYPVRGMEPGHLVLEYQRPVTDDSRPRMDGWEKVVFPGFKNGQPV